MSKNDRGRKNKQTAEAQERFNQIIDTAKELVRDFLQQALEAEFEDFMQYPKYSRSDIDNYRNGYTTKTIKTSMGEIQIDTPRDRNSQFDPHIIPKRQTVFEDLSEKVLSLYAKGMSTSDIVDTLKDIYGTAISTSLVSQITDRVLPLVEEWRSRPLERLYTVLFIDALFYKVREEGRVKSKAVYVVVGVNEEGKKEVLGFWISETESSSFWYKVLNDLKSRGVEEVLMVVADNLRGIEKAIKGAYPKAEVQKCIVHQIRSSLKNVLWKEKKEVARSLKGIYDAPTEEMAKEGLKRFKEEWGEKYWYVVKSWEENWEELMTYYRYPYEMRKLIYTTNIIESVNSVLRKVTKGKKVFPSEESLGKSIYLAIKGLEEKWERSRIRNWGIIYSQLKTLFEGRI